VTWLRTVGLRLALALVLSFALWVFVSYTQNPDRRIRFDNIPVEADGLTAGLVLVDTNGLPRTTRPTVIVSVEGAADILQTVGERDLRAFYDLTDITPGQYVLDVQVESTRAERLQIQFTPDPFRLPVRIEQEITRTVELTVTINGSVPFSFEALEPSVTVRSQSIRDVSVRGPQNRVERVAAVRATADIDRLTSTYNSPRTLEAVDSDGRAVDGVILDPPQVLVQIPIISSVGVKRVPIVPVLAGEPSSGYIILGVSVAPQLVTLTGSSGPLDDVESVSTSSVAVGGASRTFTQTVDLEEPALARLRFGEPTQAVVTVQIGQLNQAFQVTLPIPVQAVGLESGLLVSISPAAVPVVLEGRTSTLGQLDTSALVATVSVRGLGPGTYTLIPTLSLPDGVSLVGAAPDVTITLRLPPTATPEATATPTLVPGEPTLTPTATEGPSETPTAAPVVP
jgi:YbbR domain-containing protein